MGTITGDGRAVTGLGGPAGYGELQLGRGDDLSQRVDMSAVFGSGFAFGGGISAADVHISTDGLVSFGAAVAPDLRDLSLHAGPFLAPFFADVDTRLDGEGRESGPIWLDIDPVEDVVTITWQAVGFYRRNAELVNTFQLQLFDRGAGTFDTVFRYEGIAWTSGDRQGGWNGLGGDLPLIGYRFGPGGGGDAAVGKPDRGGDPGPARPDRQYRGARAVGPVLQRGQRPDRRGGQ